MQSYLINKPVSSSNFRINFLVFFLFVLAERLLFNLFPTAAPGILCFAGMFFAAALLMFYDLTVVKVHLRQSTGLSVPGPINHERVVLKLIGLYTTVIIIIILYKICPVYRITPRAAEFYGYFFNLLKMICPFFVISSVLYFFYVDRRQKEPYDGYWHMGCFVSGRIRNVKWVCVFEHFRVWFIKGFFTPFMFGLLILNLNQVFSFDWNKSPDFLSRYMFLISFFYTFDMFYGALGYLLTLKVLDNHIQSTDPSILGWLVCLACYNPFDAMFGIGLLKYDSGFTWDQWYVFTPVFYYITGLTIIALSAIYGLATVSFGYRMSNLTFRGIITDGPYHYTKHPAYLCKVISWWLIALPFYSVTGPFGAIKQTLAMIGVSAIYYLRARTEENHLSNYPEYIQYAKWIDEHGIFRGLKKIFPFMRFSEERCRKAKSIVWFKKI